jgi:hypothetical protein
MDIFVVLNKVILKIMKITCRFILPIILFALVFSCKKDDGPKSNTDLLTSRSWELSGIFYEPSLPIYYNIDSSATYIGANDLSEDSSHVIYLGNLYDYYSFYKLSCEDDDYRDYSKDNTYLDDRGEELCSTTQAQTTSGQWFFNDDETLYTEIPAGSASSFQYKIEELNEDKFVISSWFLEGLNDTVSIPRMEVIVYKALD